MERELVGLLGAGLTSMATGYGVAVPVGAIDSGYALVDVLSRESGPRIGGAITAMVQTLWLDWQQMGLDRETLAHHAGALPAIVELNRPLPEMFASCGQAAHGSATLAAHVIEAARRSADIQRAGLDEGICYALLDKLYGTILGDQAVLPEMMAAVDLCLRTGLWREPGGTNPSMPPPPRSAPEAVLVARLSQVTVNTIRSAVEGFGRSIADPEARIERHCNALVALIERLTSLAPEVPELSGELINAARDVAAGDLNAADHALSLAERGATHRATASLASARQMMTLAAEVLSCRATLEECRLDYRKAARQYRTAARCLTSADAARLWTLHNRQAEALLEYDRLRDDPSVLIEATRALADAVALDPRRVGEANWAEGQTRLARTLLDAGARTRDATRHFEAARHAAIAAAAFAELGLQQPQSEAQGVHGRALWLGAEACGDLVALEKAATAIREALERCSRDQEPERWIELSSILGQALLRGASVRNDPRLLPSAIEHLRNATQFAATCNIAFDALETEAALGRALLGEFAAGGAPLLLDLAATAFRRAIKAAKASASETVIADLRHELGMTLWAAAERNNDAYAHEAAVAALEASIEAFDRLGSSDRAMSVRGDLARLNEPRSAAVAR